MAVTPYPSLVKCFVPAHTSNFCFIFTFYIHILKYLVQQNTSKILEIDYYY